MAFDGFTLKAVVNELQFCLIGGKVTKIYEPTPEEIILGIYSNGCNYALSLNVSALYSLHLTTKSKPNPLAAPSFCMLLRKYLIGCKIKSISMLGFERITVLDLEGYNELNDLVVYKLMVELMGKHSNIILVNQDNNIIDSLKHFTTFSGSYRNIMPNCHYQFPELNRLDVNETAISLEDYETILKNFEHSNPSDKIELHTLSSYFLEHFSGLSKPLIDYAVDSLGISDDFTFENYQTLLSYLKDLAYKIENSQVGCITFEKDYTLVSIPSSSSIDCDSSNLKVNFFLDDYYANKEQLEEFTQYRNSLLSFIAKKLKKIAKKLDGVNEKIKECSNMDKYQLYGELLTSNLYQMKDTHISQITLENYYEQNSPITIPLDISLSPADNAKKYFKKYHKLKNTIDIVTQQKTELEKEIDYLESIVYELQVTKTIQELNNIYQEMEDNNLFSRRTTVQQGVKAFQIGKRAAKRLQHEESSEKHRVKNKTQNDFLSYQIGGFTVLVGKNNQENDYLTLKIAKENDIWFHVKDMQGSHVILVTEQKEPSQEIINQVASICAHYSKASQSSNVPVDYTLAKYVKKPAKAKPGMVIYTNQKTINVQPSNIS